MTRPGIASLLVPAALAALCGCATAGGRAAGAEPAAHLVASAREESGIAVYYAARYAGRPTASGEAYDPRALTAAHRSLPFGTRVRVTNLANDRSVVVTINDRGPYSHGRILDLSHRAARELGFLGAGEARVRAEVIDR